MNHDQPAIVSDAVAEACRESPRARAWLASLPAHIDSLTRRWSLTVGTPFGGDEVRASWVAPVTCADGTQAVLKIGLPHMEAEHEGAGLRFWNGEPTVRLLAEDEALGALLLERADPGTILRTLPEPEQDVVLAGLLKRLWRMPAKPHPFRPLSEMTAAWGREAREQTARAREVRGREPRGFDAALVRAGLELFEELPRNAPREALLATDLHAGNVVRAQREPWLVIDPKPFVGDVTYDATQHLLNCDQRMRTDPLGTIRRFADLLDLDTERLRLWMFARVAVGPHDDAPDAATATLARALAP